jgi:hypothetical protein
MVAPRGYQPLDTLVLRVGAAAFRGILVAADVGTKLHKRETEMSGRAGGAPA